MVSGGGDGGGGVGGNIAFDTYLAPGISNLGGVQH